MSTLTSVIVPVPQLATGDQVIYFGVHYIVQEVLEMLPELGGWVVIAKAVQDRSPVPARIPLIYANRPAMAELVHRTVEGPCHA